jgi:hypothetical protein
MNFEADIFQAAVAQGSSVQHCHNGVCRKVSRQ